MSPAVCLRLSIFLSFSFSIPHIVIVKRTCCKEVLLTVYATQRPSFLHVSFICSCDRSERFPVQDCRNE